MRWLLGLACPQGLCPPVNARHRRLRGPQEQEARSSLEAGSGQGWPGTSTPCLCTVLRGHSGAKVSRCWPGKAEQVLICFLEARAWLAGNAAPPATRGSQTCFWCRAPGIRRRGWEAARRRLAAAGAQTVPSVTTLVLQAAHPGGCSHTDPGCPGHCTSLCPPPASLCPTRTPRLFWDRPGNAGEPACRRA